VPATLAFFDGASDEDEGEGVTEITKKVEQLDMNGNKKNGEKLRKRGKKWSEMTEEEKVTKKLKDKERREKIREKAYGVVDTYFKDKTHLQILQEMCMKLLDMPENDRLSSVQQCLRALAEVHVNIFDYVDGILPVRRELIFDNVHDLIDRCDYLKKRREPQSSGGGVGYYPIERAKGEEGLRDLLRSLFHGRRRGARRN
jgi:hypothetical protein